MSDDDPVEALVEGTVEPFGDEDDGPSVPETRDMETELRERTGVDPDEPEDFAEVDSETATAFWSAVIYVNLGVLLIAVGPVVYTLRGRALVAAALVVAGIALLLRAYLVYRKFDADSGDDAADGDDEGSESDDPGDADGDGDSVDG